MRLKPRPYQTEAKAAVYAYWQAGGGNALVVLPTGTGKSYVMADIAQDLIAQHCRLRIGIVTHVQELIGQNAQELMGLWPQAPVGIYSAGLGSRSTRHQIMFMGIQSVYDKADLFGGFDLLMIDEADLVPRESETMYGQFIGRCRDLVPDMRILGLTATDYRLDTGSLTHGKGAMFDDVVYEAFVGDMIAQGYLCPLIGPPTLARINADGLRVANREFVTKDASERGMAVVEEACAEVVEKGRDRVCWLTFAQDVRHARGIAAEYRKHGISTEVLLGTTPKGERKQMIARYRAGRFQSLVSVGVATVGLNVKQIDLLALMRLTKSPRLYTQMVGRTFRPLYAHGYDLDDMQQRIDAIAAGPKPNALVLDFAGNVQRHGPIDNVTKPVRRELKDKDKDQDEKLPTVDDMVFARLCPRCQSLAERNIITCETCGFEWPAGVPGHQGHAHNVAILSTELIEPEWKDVWGIHVARHEKMGAAPSMKVRFSLRAELVSTWLCFDGRGRALSRAHSMWLKLGGAMPLPSNTVEAMERKGEFGTVTGILTRPNGKFKDVLDVRLKGHVEVNNAGPLI